MRRAAVRAVTVAAMSGSTSPGMSPGRLSVAWRGLGTNQSKGLRCLREGDATAGRRVRVRLRANQGEGSPVTLRVVHVTDVYTLDHLPSLKTLIETKKAELPPGSYCMSVLTGDFLAPYLLSSVDRGRGMISMLNAIGLEFLTWGNHEADLSHRSVMKRVQEFSGTFINTNMTDHESCHLEDSNQRDAVVLDLQGGGGAHRRRVGLVGLLINTECLYRPKAFGSAKIGDPVEVLGKYAPRLWEDEGCDLVLPLTHLYEHQDAFIAASLPKGSLPLILGGHDHHVVDRTLPCGTRILKPGSDAEHAYVVDITWPHAGAKVAPQVSAELVKVSHWPPDQEATKVMREAYSVLEPLRRTVIAEVNEEYRPLSSVGTRRRPCTMGSFLCTEIRAALRASRNLCSCCLIKGGSIRAEMHHTEARLTLAALDAELPRDSPVGIGQLPGHVLADELEWNRSTPGVSFLQTDMDIEETPYGRLLLVNGQPLDPDQMYWVASFPGLWHTEGSPVTEYVQSFPEHMPDWETASPVQALLMGYWGQKAWHQIFRLLDENNDGSISQEELKKFDLQGNGVLDEGDLRALLARIGLGAGHGAEQRFLNTILEVAGDVDGDGMLTTDELNARSMEERELDRSWFEHISRIASQS